MNMMNFFPFFEKFLDAQNFIFFGSIEIKTADNKIEISRDRITVDIHTPHKLKNILPLDIGDFKDVGNFRDLLKMLDEAGEMLKAKKKTLILKYRGVDVVVIGYDASPGMFKKNFEIKSKISLMKLLGAYF